MKYKGLFVEKGSGSRSGIFPDPGDPKRPDPTGSGTGSGSATLVFTHSLIGYKIVDYSTMETLFLV